MYITLNPVHHRRPPERLRQAGGLHRLGHSRRGLDYLLRLYQPLRANPHVGFLRLHRDARLGAVGA